MGRLLIALGLAVVARLAVAPVLRFFDNASTWLDYPYPRSGTEGLTLYETLLFKTGGNIYDPITSDRFISAPYPPIYYALAASALPEALPGFSTAGAIFSLFRPGRMISLVAGLLTAILVAMLVVLDSAADGDSRKSTAPGVVGGVLAGTL
ncbi:MAG TPA: hypothetical protein VM409_05640, partial [Chloroflexia bacterium]|nr:hypothetical protein [Chloroflexia bacterium]